MNLSRCANSLAILAAGLRDGHEPTILRHALEVIQSNGYASRNAFELGYIEACGRGAIMRSPFAPLLDTMAYEEYVATVPEVAGPTWEQQEAAYHSAAELSSYERREIAETRWIYKSLDELMAAYWSLTC